MPAQATDGCSPILFDQEQHGGNERTGVADADPPNEVDDGESPSDRNVQSPDADATGKEHVYRQHQQVDEAEGEERTYQPLLRGVLPG